MSPVEPGRLVVRTPEGVAFSFALASPVLRGLAWWIDSVLILAATWLANLIIQLFGVISVDWVGFFSALTYFAGSFAYRAGAEWLWRGQTIGKRLLRLRVMDARGLRLSGAQAALRNLMRALDSLPLFYVVGALTCLSSRRFQRLGDLVAGTVVVWAPRLPAPDFSRLEPLRFNSLRALPHLAARLRQTVSPEEAQLAVEALLRREELEPAARVEVFRAVADLLRAKARYPAEVIESLADEAYARAVVDIVFAPPTARKK